MRRYSNIKWTKTGLRLLEDAVVIWKEWANNADEDRESCPLCDKYFFVDDACDQCPICQFTDTLHCEDTPFYDVVDEQPKTIRTEINFLKRLAANGRKVLGVKP